MSNKKLSFVEAVKSGKDFRCVESGEEFYRKNAAIKHEVGVLLTYIGELKIFSTEWLDQTFEIIEVKKELTAREIEEAVYYAIQQSGVLAECDLITKFMLRKLGF